MAGRITLAGVEGNLVSAQNYVEGTPFCEFCGVQLVRVRGIPRDDGHTEPFYRLAPRRSHGTCKYNEALRINRIVMFSLGFTGVEPIVRDQRGRAVFRLGVVGDALRRMQNGQLPDPIQDGAGNITITATRVQRQLLRTAKSVLGLASRIRDLPELASLVRISNNEIEIRWRDFFYDTDSMQRLFTFAQNSHGFPIAFAVRIRAVYPPTPTRNSYMIACHGSQVLQGEQASFFSPTLWVSDPAIANGLVPDQGYLILGLPTAVRRNGGYHNMNVTINSNHQICRL